MITVSKSPTVQRAIRRVIVAFSAFVAISSSVIALLILNDPTSPPVSSNAVDPGDKLYLYLFVVRAVSLSVITLIVLGLRSRAAIIPVIALLGSNQIADGVIGAAAGHGFNPAPTAQGILLLLGAGYLATTAARAPIAQI